MTEPQKKKSEISPREAAEEELPETREAQRKREEEERAPKPPPEPGAPEYGEGVTQNE